MKRELLLPSVYLLDQCLGDPECLPHPVRMMGFAITRGERILRSPDDGKSRQLISGVVLTAVVVAGSYAITSYCLRRARVRAVSFGNVIEVILGFTCIASRDLEQEAVAVIDALRSDDMERARRRLARIVGRDTSSLNASEISRALIETVAESASDGVIAPLFYMATGGVPLAMAYKAVNTLDSMIGHAEERYFYFGKCAARLDDLANYLPSRITALALVLAARLDEEGDAKSAWHVWHRDGSKHKSPNAGQPESAMSGALQTRLGGTNSYDGEIISTPHMGEEFPPPHLSHAEESVRLMTKASILTLAVGVVAVACFSAWRRK